MLRTFLGFALFLFILFLGWDIWRVSGRVGWGAISPLHLEIVFGALALLAAAIVIAMFTFFIAKALGFKTPKLWSRIAFWSDEWPLLMMPGIGKGKEKEKIREDLEKFSKFAYYVQLGVLLVLLFAAGYAYILMSSLGD